MTKRGKGYSAERYAGNGRTPFTKNRAAAAKPTGGLDGRRRFPTQAPAWPLPTDAVRPPGASRRRPIPGKGVRLSRYGALYRLWSQAVAGWSFPPPSHTRQRRPAITVKGAVPLVSASRCWLKRLPPPDTGHYVIAERLYGECRTATIPLRRAYGVRK
jgi:hypothetical protein